MAEADIPVDLFNPGQVFACLGFLEAADILLGDAEGGFDWHGEETLFRLRATGESNPFEAVLNALTHAEVVRFGPNGYTETVPKEEDVGAHGEADHRIDLSETFPVGEGDRMSLPIRIDWGNHPAIELGHWTDGSDRENFKLYSGNRSADKIVSAMLKGVRKKPSKQQTQNGQRGDLKTKGLVQLWEENAEELTEKPFHLLTPMGGSFNFDPHGAWTALDAGYSPNDQKPKHSVEASPVVEFFAAWGLEHARPEVFNGRLVRYAVWGIPLSAMLARASLIGAISSIPVRYFRFKLAYSGKNKIVTFSEEEIHP